MEERSFVALHCGEFANGLILWADYSFGMARILELQGC
jgi:hypothetical protein